MAENETFDLWGVVELMGHRRVVGRVAEHQIAGVGFLRVDIPTDPPSVQFYAPQAVYAITPISEEAARLAATRTADPITVWELPSSIREAVRRMELDTLSDESGDVTDLPF